jgi:hypothetical protein
MLARVVCGDATPDARLFTLSYKRLVVGRRAGSVAAAAI